jgi:hypothetical protein
MTKRERDFFEFFADLFDERLLPLISVIWILILGVAVWAIDPEQIEYWFPRLVLVSGLLIVLGESLAKVLSRRRK